MPPNGYIQVHAFESYAQLPLQDVSIAITTDDGTAIALRLTDRSGKIVPIPIPTPALSESQSPGLSGSPFASVRLTAKAHGYEQIEIRDLQIFPDTVTLQDLELIPFSELPASRKQQEIFTTNAQDL